jgi:ankyrin repeat protein
MHQAVWQGNLETVQSLVEYGADIHTADVIGRTPLHLCRHKNIAEYLLSIGATPSLPPWSIWYELSSGSVGGLTSLAVQVSQMASSLGNRSILPDSLDRSLLSMFVSNGNNLDMVDDVGRSIVHLAMCTYATGSVVLNGNVRLTGSKPFPWHRMCYPTMAASWIGRLWRFYRRRFHAEDLRQVSNLHPEHGWSPMCLATCSDDTLVMASCLEMGADINFEGSPYGSPLMAAAFSNRLKSVKFLVRNGAAICYEGKGGFKSAVIIGKRCQKVIEWLIMGRFRDQEKLEAVPDPSDEVGIPPRVATGVWSSMVAPLRLIGDFERQPHESSFDYLLRLVVIKRDMRGKVVPLPRREAIPR